jgi:hypothetical protein
MDKVRRRFKKYARTFMSDGNAMSRLKRDFFVMVDSLRRLFCSNSRPHTSAAIAIQYFGIVMIAWWFIISLNVFLLVTNRPYAHLERTYMICGWLLPLLFAIVPLMLNVYQVPVTKDGSHMIRHQVILGRLSAAFWLNFQNNVRILPQHLSILRLSLSQSDFWYQTDSRVWGAAGPSSSSSTLPALATPVSVAGSSAGTLHARLSHSIAAPSSFAPPYVSSPSSAPWLSSLLSPSSSPPPNATGAPTNWECWLVERNGSPWPVYVFFDGWMCAACLVGLPLWVWSMQRVYQVWVLNCAELCESIWDESTR